MVGHVFQTDRVALELLKSECGELVPFVPINKFAVGLVNFVALRNTIVRQVVVCVVVFFRYSRHVFSKTLRTCLLGGDLGIRVF